MVLVPFPMSEDNRAQREAQKDAVKLGPSIDFHFRPVKAAPANYVSHHDSVLADMSILEAGLIAQEEGYDAARLVGLNLLVSRRGVHRHHERFGNGCLALGA